MASAHDLSPIPICYCSGGLPHNWDPQAARRGMPCPTVPKLKPLPDQGGFRRRRPSIR